MAIEDLTTEILLQLPVKSILRFKSVSKLWLSIASSRQFRQIHASRIVNRLNPIGLFTTRYPETDKKVSVLPFGGQYLTNTFSFLNEPINIKSSSGGLLLLLVKSCQSFNLQLRCDRDYFVCNPTTNEFKHLAGLPHLIRDAKFVSETLAFDPSKSPNYKVIFLFKYHELDKEFQIVIYSSETQTFSSPLPTTSTLVNFRFCGIYCYDAIHWISYDKSCYYYFHLKTERMKESPLPSNLFKFSQYFGESRGHLHLVTVFRHQIPLLEVYELESDYSGWSLKYQVDLDSMAKALPESYMYSTSEMHSAFGRGMITVFSIFVDKEEEENMVMVYLVCGICMAHNFKRKLSTELRFTMPSRYDDRDRLYKGWPVAHQFIETLACVETHACL